MVNGRDVDGKGGNDAMIEGNIRTMDMSEPWIGVEMEEVATIYIPCSISCTIDCENESDVPTRRKIHE